MQFHDPGMIYLLFESVSLYRQGGSKKDPPAAAFKVTSDVFCSPNQSSVTTFLFFPIFFELLNSSHSMLEKRIHEKQRNRKTQKKFDNKNEISVKIG